MTDLDQASLKRMAHEGPFVTNAGRDYVFVPRDLLERVTREFDCSEVRECIETRYAR